MSENNTTPVSGYLAAALIGAAVGAGIALLYAPCSGKETRKMLARQAKDLKDRAESAMEDAKEFISNRRADVKEALETGRDAIRAERAKHKA